MASKNHFAKDFRKWWRYLPGRKKRQLLTNSIVTSAIFLTVIAMATIRYLDDRTSAVSLDESLAIRQAQMEQIEAIRGTPTPTVAVLNQLEYTSGQVKSGSSFWEILRDFFVKIGSLLGIKP